MLKILPVEKLLGFRNIKIGIIGEIIVEKKNVTKKEDKEMEKSEYSLESIIKNMSQKEEIRKKIEDDIFNVNTAGKRNTRNMILKSCEQEENFKRWKKDMAKVASETESQADDKYIDTLKQTSKMFEDILYDEGTTIDESMPDYGTLSKYI